VAVRFVRNKKSYWGEHPLGCECGAILPVRAEKVRIGSGVTCTNCNAFVTFDTWDVEAIAAEILRLKTGPHKPAPKKSD
jgi:hypothetical protein